MSGDDDRQRHVHDDQECFVDVLICTVQLDQHEHDPSCWETQRTCSYTGLY